MLEASEDAPDTPSENQPLVQEEPQETAATPIVSVMTAYQNANRWLDIVKEDLLINKGMVFFSNYIHDLAHTMPSAAEESGCGPSTSSAPSRWHTGPHDRRRRYDAHEPNPLRGGTQVQRGLIRTCAGRGCGDTPSRPRHSWDEVDITLNR